MFSASLCFFCSRWYIYIYRYSFTGHGLIQNIEPGPGPARVEKNRQDSLVEISQAKILLLFRLVPGLWARTSIGPCGPTGVRHGILITCQLMVCASLCNLCTRISIKFRLSRVLTLKSICREFFWPWHCPGEKRRTSMSQDW